MGDQARVTNVGVLEEVKTALSIFAKDADDALCMVSIEARRLHDWLENQLFHWKEAIRVYQDEVVQAKMALDSRKMMKVFDREPDCTEEEKALRKARARLEDAEEKHDNCKRWPPILRRAIEEFEGPSRQLANFLEGDIPRGMALLDHMMQSLESYGATRSTTTSTSSVAKTEPTVVAPPRKSQEGPVS